MKTRYLVILATLTFLGFSAPAFAPPHGACTPWPSCKNDVDPPPSVDNSGLFTVEVFFEPLPVTGQAATASAALVNNVVGEDSDRRPSVGATDMDRAWNQDRSGKVDPILVENITIATAQRFDIFFGGMTGAPKFPSLASVALLWRAYLRTGTPQFAQIVMTSLDSMSRGGIYDHVGGGFARYAVDERWILPHFEKMLYDNAQFIEMLTLIWQTGRNPTFRNRVEGIVEWLNREMLVEDSAFAASLDADSEGEEGKYYVWTEAEIDAALIGTLIPRFKQVYGVTAEGNYNGRNVLHRYIPFTDLTEADENLFAAQLKKLHEVREKRVKPLRDDKVLADWNGMMIAALAYAGPVLERPEWVRLAEKAFASFTIRVIFRTA